MIRRPPRSTQSRSSAASDVYKRQHLAIGRERVGVADLPGAQRLARQPEFAAGGEDGDPRAAGDGDAVAAYRRQQADLGRAETCAAREEDVAVGDVLFPRGARWRPAA